MATTATITAKAKKSVSKAGNILSNNPRTTVLVLQGIAAVAGIYVAYKLVERFTNGESPNAGGGVLDTTGGNTVPYGATITENQAQTIAAGLHQAMVVFNGTDEDKIYNLLSGKNAKDFALISEAFGKKRYDDFGDAYWPFPTQNLTYWLNSELNAEELQKLRGLMPGVL